MLKSDAMNKVLAAAVNPHYAHAVHQKLRNDTVDILGALEACAVDAESDADAFFSQIGVDRKMISNLLQSKHERLLVTLDLFYANDADRSIMINLLNTDDIEEVEHAVKLKFRQYLDEATFKTTLEDCTEKQNYPYLAHLTRNVSDRESLVAVIESLTGTRVRSASTNSKNTVTRRLWM